MQERLEKILSFVKFNVFSLMKTHSKGNTHVRLMPLRRLIPACGHP